MPTRQSACRIQTLILGALCACSAPKSQPDTASAALVGVGRAAIEAGDREEFARLQAAAINGELQKRNPNYRLELRAIGADAATLYFNGPGATQVSQLVFGPGKPMAAERLQEFGFRHVIVRESSRIALLGLNDRSVRKLHLCAEGEQRFLFAEDMCGDQTPGGSDGWLVKRRAHAEIIQARLDEWQVRGDNCDADGGRRGCFSVKLLGEDETELVIEAPRATKWGDEMFFTPVWTHSFINKTFNGVLSDSRLAKLGFRRLTIRGSGTRATQAVEPSEQQWTIH